MSQFVNDTFSGTTGIDLNAHTGELGATWTRNGAFSSNSITITAANRTRSNTVNVPCVYHPSGTPGTADYTVQCEIDFAGGAANNHLAGVGLRASTTAHSGIYFVYDGADATEYTIYRMVNGAATLLANDTTSIGSPGASHTIQLQAAGSQFTAFRDSGQILQVTDTTYAAAGAPALWIYTTVTPADSTGIHVDNYIAESNPPPPVIIAVNDANFFHSPYNQFVSGSTYVQSCNLGSYHKLNVANTTSAILNLDVTPLSGAAVSAANYPILWWQVDRGADGVEWHTQQLASGMNTLSLFSGLALGSHAIFLYYDTTWIATDNWTTPVNVIRITGVTIDNGGSSAAPPLRPKRAIFYSDSTGNGNLNLNNAGLATSHDAYMSWVRMAAEGLNAEYGHVCFGGQGIQANGVGNVPPWWAATAAGRSIDNYFSGQTRLVGGLFSPTPDDIVIGHGYNDGVVDTSADVQAALGALRGWSSLTTRITWLLPPSGRNNSFITTGVTNYKTANPSDLYVRTVDFQLSAVEQALRNGNNTTVNSGQNSACTDDTHPWASTHAGDAARFMQGYNAAWAPTPTPIRHRPRAVGAA